MTTDEQAAQIKNPLSPILLAHPFQDGGIGSLMFSAAAAYADDYVMSSDEGADHSPTEFEGWMLEDFWNGLLSEESFFGPVRLLIEALQASQTRAEEAERERDGLAWIADLYDGTPTGADVANELADYAMILDNVGKVYCHVTGGRVSKANTLANAVIAVSDDYFTELVAEEVKEAEATITTLKAMVGELEGALKAAEGPLRYAYQNVDSVTATKVKAEILPAIAALTHPVEQGQ